MTKQKNRIITNKTFTFVVGGDTNCHITGNYIDMTVKQCDDWDAIYKKRERKLSNKEKLDKTMQHCSTMAEVLINMTVEQNNLVSTITPQEKSVAIERLADEIYNTKF